MGDHQNTVPGLQIRERRFDSGRHLQTQTPSTASLDAVDGVFRFDADRAKTRENTSVFGPKVARSESAIGHGNEDSKPTLISGPTGPYATGYLMAQVRYPDGRRKVCTYHRFVWESANGELPRGVVVHHRNHDKSDNRLENLQAIGLAEHGRQHHSKPLDRMTCPQCGESFQVRATHRRKNQDGPFCGRSCAGKWTRAKHLRGGRPMTPLPENQPALWTPHDLRARQCIRCSDPAVHCAECGYHHHSTCYCPAVERNRQEALRRNPPQRARSSFRRGGVIAGGAR